MEITQSEQQTERQMKKKILMTSNVAKDVEQLELSYTAGGNI